MGIWAAMRALSWATSSCSAITLRARDVLAAARHRHNNHSCFCPSTKVFFSMVQTASLRQLLDVVAWGNDCAA